MFTPLVVNVVVKMAVNELALSDDAANTFPSDDGVVVA
jgi:hypothetical protein